MKEKVFEIFFEIFFDFLNLTVSFMTIVVNKQNSVLHPCLPPDQGYAQEMLPLELWSLASLQPRLPVIYLRSWRMWCCTLRIDLSFAGCPSNDPLSMRCRVQALEKKKGAPDKCLIHTLGMNNA